jgi:hypothetical protein
MITRVALGVSLASRRPLQYRKYLQPRAAAAETRLKTT